MIGSLASLTSTSTNHQNLIFLIETPVMTTPVEFMKKS